MLDNTVVLWCSEISVGVTHSYENMPYVLLGGAGGGLRSGRFVELQGRTHSDLFVTLQNALGIEATSFGNPEYVTGPIETLLT